MMRPLLESLRDLAELLYKREKAEDPSAAKKEIAAAARSALAALGALEEGEAQIDRKVISGTRDVLGLVLKASGSREGDDGDLGAAASNVVRLLAYLEGIQVDRKSASAARAAREFDLRPPQPDGADAAFARVGSIPTLLWMRRRLLLLILVILIPAGFGFFKIIPRHYEAVVLLGEGGEGAPQGESSLDWEITNLSALALAQLTELPKTHALLAEQLERVSARPALHQAEYDAIVKRGVNAIRITATHPRAESAALVANALTDVLLERNRAFLRDQIMGSVGNLRARETREKLALTKVETRIRELEERNDLRFMDRRIQTALSEVASLSRQILVAQNEWEFVANESKILELQIARRDQARARRRPKSAEPKPTKKGPTPEVAELLLRREELLLGFKPEHPLVTSLDRRIALLRRRSDEAEKTHSPQKKPPVDTSVGPEEIDLRLAEHQRHHKSIEEKIKGLRKMEAQWRGRIRTMTEAAPLLSQLKADRVLAASKVEAIEERLANLLQQAENPAGHFKIMEEAAVPTTPIAAVSGLVVAMGVLTAWLLSMVLVLGVDLHRRRIITAEDGEETLGTTTYEAFGLEEEDAQTTRAFFDRLVQSILEDNPEGRSIAVVGVDSHSDSRQMWEHLGGATSRLGRDTALFDLSEVESGKGAGLPAPLSFWLGQGPARMGVMLLPDLRSGSRAAKFAQGADNLVVVARSKRHGASELSFWIDTLPKGRRAVNALVLTGGETHSCIGIESLVLTIDALEDGHGVEEEETRWWKTSPRDSPP